MTDYNKILGIPSHEVLRIETGISELDWLMGNTIGSDGIACWGLPVGKISLWAGAPGVGKSRAAKHIACSLIELGFLTKYFYLEEGMKPLQEIIDETVEGEYQVIVIDSINCIEEYGVGSEGRVRNIIDKLREICDEVRTHIIILAQLNKEGNVRGSNVLLHLPDIVMRMRRGHIWNGAYLPDVGSHFTLETTGKHRFAVTGPRYAAAWKHYSDHVECLSNYRLEDNEWRTTHGLPFKLDYQAGDEVEEEEVPMGIWDIIKAGFRTGWQESRSG